MRPLDPDLLLTRYHNGEISRAQFVVEFSDVRWSEDGDRKKDDGTDRPELLSYCFRMEDKLWQEISRIVVDRRNDRGRLWVIHRYAEGKISREELIDALATWNYLPQDGPTDGHDSLLVPTPGSWDDVELGFDTNLIPEDYFEDIYHAFREHQRSISQDHVEITQKMDSPHEETLRRYLDGEIPRIQFIVEMSEQRWSEEDNRKDDDGNDLPSLQEFRSRMDDKLWLEISRIVVDRRFNHGVVSVCRRYADGKISYEELVDTLGNWTYLPTLPPSDEFGDPSLTVEGSWDDILFAVHSGLIPKKSYGDILELVTRREASQESGSAESSGSEDPSQA